MKVIDARQAHENTEAYQTSHGYLSPVEKEWRYIMKQIKRLSKKGQNFYGFNTSPFSINVERLKNLGYQADSYKVEW